MMIYLLIWREVKTRNEPIFRPERDNITRTKPTNL